MSIDRYFQEELAHLKTSGEEFARYFPQLTNYLSRKSNDPDVERLLEGFAFLTSRVREKIDDQLPEVTQTLLMLLWPNFLRPVPSMTIFQFTPVKGSINERAVIKRRFVEDEQTRYLMVHSLPKGGTISQFRLAYDTEILPIDIGEVTHDVSRVKSVVTVPVSTLNDEPISSLNMDGLRFYLGGASYSALTLNLWMHQYLRSITVRCNGRDVAVLDPSHVEQIGLSAEHDLLPYPKNSFVGYRLLQEYYAFPEKYRFVDVKGIKSGDFAGEESQFELLFEFSRPLPPDVRISKQSFLLHCVPGINLFDHDSEPILLDGRRVEYKVLPAKRDASDIEIFSIEKVTGWRSASGAGENGISREFSRFESFTHEIERTENRAAIYFREKVKQSLSGEKLDFMLSFVREDELELSAGGETISVELTGTNGQKPHDLRVGDICVPTKEIPSFVTIENISRPTTAKYPIVDGTLQWQLISALSLNYLSLQNPEALHQILGLYDFSAKVDRQREREATQRIEAIESIETTRIDRLFKGLPVRGLRTTMGIRDSKFASEGEMFLFATILAEFFALYVTINSFHELVVHGLDAGEEYRWTARIGTQPLI